MIEPAHGACPCPTHNQSEANAARPPHGVFARRILLAATGLAPQVLTETLYALGISATGAQRFLPTEIHLITTQEGARFARAALLHPDGGQFHALLGDYPALGQPLFSAEQIHLIRDSAGMPLADIRSPADNAAAADSITALMAELTRDAGAALHVSIAGGRKTMGFYLGYAFSLFARPQDALSHVLVSPPFESHPEFFYPPPTPRRLPTNNGRHLDTAEAVITLAPIPVVRLRHGQPQALLGREASFSETVTAIQQSLAPPHLRINLATRQVSCGGTPVRLPPALLAWFTWWARLAREGHDPQTWRTASANDFLAIYRATVGEDATVYENTRARLADGMEKEFFEQNNAKLDRTLRDQLGPRAEPYLLRRTGKRPHTARYLAIPPTAIELHATE